MQWNTKKYVWSAALIMYINARSCDNGMYIFEALGLESSIHCAELTYEVEFKII